MNALGRERVGRSRPKLTFDVATVWKQVTPELEAELLEFWERNHAIGDAERARQRAAQAVCIARDADGTLCAVSTAVVRVLPLIGEVDAVTATGHPPGPRPTEGLIVQLRGPGDGRAEAARGARTFGPAPVPSSSRASGGSGGCVYDFGPLACGGCGFLGVLLPPALNALRSPQAMMVPAGTPFVGVDTWTLTE